MDVARGTLSPSACSSRCSSTPPPSQQSPLSFTTARSQPPALAYSLAATASTACLRKALFGQLPGAKSLRQITFSEGNEAHDRRTQFFFNSNFLLFRWPNRFKFPCLLRRSIIHQEWIYRNCMRQFLAGKNLLTHWAQRQLILGSLTG